MSQSTDGPLFFAAKIGFAVIALLVIVIFFWNPATPPPPSPATSAAPSDGSRSRSASTLDAPFLDVTAEMGLDFEHTDGRSGRRYYVETASGGGGFIDADGDGLLDIYLLNGAASPGSSFEEPPRNALYLQRDGRFIEVGATAGVGDTGFGMGLCAADLDGDGQLDFLITNYGADRLFLHRGLNRDGVPRYVGASESIGLEGERWGTGCAFGDVDGDGDLDLYVVNYVDFRYERFPTCGDAARGITSYCRPSVYAGQPDQLYINISPADGSKLRFREQGAERGVLQGRDEKGFGVVMSDIDGDRDLDILVANDGTPNRLYINDGRGYFREEGLQSGFALDRDGHAGSGMGLDAADLDGDGLSDMLVTNYAHESHTLMLGRPGARFDDRTSEWGLLRPSFSIVGWGARFFDLENDGDLDLAVANGHVMDNIELFEPTASYAQPNHLYVNDGAGFELRPLATPGFTAETARVSRALATGDFDNDGRIDLLITSTNDAPRLLRNVTPTDSETRRWLGLELIGPPRNRSAIGARVTVQTDAGRGLGASEVRSGGSLMAQSDLRLHFGLSTATLDSAPGPLRVRVDWPDGTRSQHEIHQLDRYQRIHHPQNTP